MKYLSVTTADGTRFRQPLDRDTLRLGRSSSSDLVLQDQAASRHHAEIIRRTEGYFLVDEHSKNRTYLNGSPVVEPTPIRPGDTIRIGTTLLLMVDSDVSPYTIEEGTSRLTPGSSGASPGIATPPAEVETYRLDQSVPVEGPPGGAIQGAVERLEALTEVIGAPLVSPEQMSRIIFSADAQLSFNRPLDQILEAVMDLAHEAVGFDRGLLLRRKGDQLVPKIVRPSPAQTGRPVNYSRTITERAFSQRVAVISSEAPRDPRFEGAHSIDELRIRSVMCVPLWNNREVIGVIYVDTCSTERQFSRRDLQVLTFLANIAAMKIDNAELLEMAVEARALRRIVGEAARIQRCLLASSRPTIPGYALEGDTIPCHEVGGDLYDYYLRPDGQFGLGIGDVAGKGVPAALIMSNFLATLRTLSELQLPPDEMLGRMNRLMRCCIPENRYVTFFYGILDPTEHTVTYVNAGHPPPLRVRRDGSVERLALDSFFLGMFDGLTFRQRKLHIDPGDVLVAYSDGVTEQENPKREEFGERRLRETIRAARQGSPHEILEEILSAVDAHSKGARHTDDVTLVVLKREG